MTVRSPGLPNAGRCRPPKPLTGLTLSGLYRPVTPGYIMGPFGYLQVGHRRNVTLERMEMKQLIDRCITALAMALALALIAAPAYAQGGGATSSIAGTVVDSGGGVIPGATVTATNIRTAGTSTVTSQANGSFTIPALNVGTYTVNVSLQGFKTAVLKDVQVTSGGPANIKAVLEVGGLSETVVVEGATAMVQTQTSASANTITARQIASLPLQTRNTLDFVTFLPGVMTPGGNRDSIVNGLPQSSLNITVDGVSVQDNYLKTTDGFFARMSPRLDAIEEVTVTAAASGADTSGQGSTQIRFTTKSGSNSFSGSSYYYYQSEKLNTNTYFNKVSGLPKNVALQRQPGTRAGGPVLIPGIYDGRGKAFFFVNYEENRTPRTITTNSNILTDLAQSGIFRYTTAAGVQQVNLYALALATGNTSTPDPTIAAILNVMKASAAGATLEPLEGNFTAQRMKFQQPANGLTRYPTIRLDYNLSPAHRLTGSWNFNDLVSRPDTTNTRQATFPGSSNSSAQISDRYTFQTTLRSTISGSIVNELRYGMSGGATLFSPDLTKDMFNDSGAGQANQGGFQLNISSAGIANPSAGGGISAREASTKFIENNLNWLRGDHALTMGVNYTNVDIWLLTATRAGQIAFDVVTGDPASAMFTAANFPGSSTTDRTNASNLYEVLTGRISSIAGTGRLDSGTGQYVYNGDSMQKGRLREWDFFVQDNWKLRPNLTLNIGLRYALQLPFYSKDNSYATATVDNAWGISGNVAGCDPSNPTPATCNLFKQGVTPGTIPTYENLGAGVKAYNTDTNNWAPAIGMNWSPSAETGFMRKILGRQGDTSFSAGWSRAFERHGMSDFTGVFGGNPGLTTPATRNIANGNLGSPLPLLLRNGNTGAPAVCPPGSVTVACMAPSPVYPIPTSVTASINLFDPNLQVPYSDSYTVGMQRSLGTKSALEIRYVGTRNRDQWTTYNYNEPNILDNGFMQEFLNAQANLYANVASGFGTDFRYRGPGTGTVPLPIYLAYFTGSAAATSSAAYTGTNWANSNYVNPLSRLAPNPFTPAGTNANTSLTGNATFRSNAVLAGLPRNFFYANPDALGGANVTGNGGYTKYNGMQLQFRRRLSGGLQMDANYAMGMAWESTRYSFRVPRKLTRNTGGEGDVRQALKATFVYELPIGQGRRFLNGAGPVLDRIVGGWQISGTMRVQTGELIDLGNIRANGMSLKEVEKAFSLRRIGPNVIYMWPDDIMENTIKAYSRDLTGYTQGTPTGRYFSPANGPDCIEAINANYGDCGVRTLVIMGPIFRTMDLNLVKDIRIAGRKSIQFRIDALNVFDAVNFDATTGIGSTTLSGYQVDSATSGRVVQLVARFNW